MPIEKRQRSPSVPFISLRWALVHAHELYERVGRAPLLPSEAAEIWGLGAKTGSAFRRVAALRGYRLIEKADDPDRIRISHLTAILFEPHEPETKQRAFAAAALGPEIIADYAGRWSAGRPSDPVCIADLQMRHRFTAPAAKGFLPVFDEAMWFVGGGLTGVVPAAPQAPSPSPSVSIGDLVRLPTDTGDQCPDGHRVVWLADGGRYVYVEKDLVPYPVQAITRIEPSSSAYPSAPARRPRAVNTGEATPNSEAEQWLDFPSIQLPEALQYLHDLIDAAGRDWMSIFDAANLWFGQPHLARARRAAAGLCDFGFVEQQGRDRSRKLRATELGWRAIKHAGTPESLYAIREGISRFRLIVHYARVWQAGIPPPALASKQLQREQGFNAQKAARFLVVFYHCFDLIRIPVKTIGDSVSTDPGDRNPVRPEQMRATDG